MIASRALKNKYPSIAFGECYLQLNGRYLYFTNDTYNCGAVIRHGIDHLAGNIRKTIENAFEYLCSINGRTLIYGTCEKEIFEKFLAPYGYQIVFEYPSNRETTTDDDDFNPEFAVTMVLFVKHIEKPLQQGYGFYDGVIE